MTVGTFTEHEFAVTGSTEDRTMPVRLNDFINVCDFGADPTGVEDSLAAFTAAIDAARSAYIIQIYLDVIGDDPTNIKSNGIVYVPRGKYLVSGPVELIQNASSATAWSGVSITLQGESPGSTLIFGNFEDWILKTGYGAGMTGGFVIENLSITNNNTTPFVSGCVYNGGQCCSNRNLILRGMVGMAIQSSTMWNGGVYNCVFLGPGFGIDSLGCSQCADNTVLSGCYFTNWDTALLVNRNAITTGNLFERNRIALYSGGNMGESDGTFQGPNPETNFGFGLTTGGGYYGNSFISNGVSLYLRATIGNIAGFYVDCTPAPDINPTSGNNVQDGMDNNRTIGRLANGFVTGGPIDGLAYNFSGLLGPANLTPGMWCEGLITDVAYADRGGTVGQSAGESNSWTYATGDKRPTWTFDSLPWDTLSNAFIDDTTFTYSTAARSMGASVGAYLFGPDFGDEVIAGTQPSSRGTTFGYPMTITSGDGTGAPGNIFTFTGDYDGPTPIVGASIQVQGSSGNYWSQGYVDDGSGTMSSGSVTETGDIFTCMSVSACTGATISDGAAGAGNILSFSSTSNLAYMNAQGARMRVAIDVDGAGGIPRDTFIVSKVTDTQWIINRDLNIASTTIYVLPDFRVGIKFDSQSPPDNESRPSPIGATFEEELSLSQWRISEEASYGPSGPLCILQPTAFENIVRTLVDQVNDNQWEISGDPLLLGSDIAVTLPDTYFVNISQDTGAPQDFTVVYDHPGKIHEISDSPIAAWTGSVSNAGQVITEGGGTYHVRVRFDQNQGYVIVG